MKILFIYLFMSLGGVETVLKNRCEGFQSIGAKADFIFLEDRGGGSSFKSLQSSQIFVTNDLQEIEKIIIRGDYDVVSVIDTPQAHVLLRKIAKSQRVLMEVHTPHPVMRKYIKTDVVEDAIAVIVPTSTFGTLVASEMKKPHPPIVPMPNPVNRLFMQDFEQIPKHNRVPIAYVGRIEQIKDWKESTRIVQQVIRRRKDIDFYMIGRLIDERPEAVFREFSREGLAGHVKWLPFIEYDKMPAFYNFISANNGVYLTSSKGESFGMTLIESMACKLPIVAADLPVFREVLGEGRFGKLYTSVEEASDHILSFVEKREERESFLMRAYSYVQKNFTPSIFAEKWSTLIKTEQ
jgi:glycosyltransferase involved in cell wall biosynthesis